MTERQLPKWMIPNPELNDPEEVVTRLKAGADLRATGDFEEAYRLHHGDEKFEVPNPTVWGLLQAGTVKREPIAGTLMNRLVLT